MGTKQKNLEQELHKLDNLVGKGTRLHRNEQLEVLDDELYL